ncbi:hypothetical protein D3C78_1720060 [compost metagenome]
MQCHGEQCCAQAEQNGRLTADFRHRRQQGQGLQGNGQHQQGADQVLQLVTWTFVPVRDDGCKGQVEQAEKGQVQCIGVLQVRCGFGTQARDEGQQQGSCAH